MPLQWKTKNIMNKKERDRNLRHKQTKPKKIYKVLRPAHPHPRADQSSVGYLNWAGCPLRPPVPLRSSHWSDRSSVLPPASPTPASTPTGNSGGRSENQKHTSSMKIIFLFVCLPRITAAMRKIFFPRQEGKHYKQCLHTTLCWMNYD